jgi:hypothetical protein
MSRLPQVQRASSLVFRALSWAVFLIGLGLAAYAGVQWLQTAHWQPLTVDRALTGWSATHDWMAHPHSWYGLHEIIAWVLHVPLFVIVTLVGGAMIIICPASHEMERRRL